jgi:hypothetical protein
MDLKELKESTAVEILKSIKASAAVYSDPNQLQALASAYALVIESTPEDKTNVVYS